MITLDLLIEQIGKFHPLLLHIPLSIIALLPLVYTATFFKQGKIWLPTIPYMVHFASLTVIPTCIAGLLAAGFDEVSQNIYWHRLLTLICAGLILMASGYLFMIKNKIEEKVPVPLLILSGLSFIFLVAGAHFGAISVHDELFIIWPFA